MLKQAIRIHLLLGDWEVPLLSPQVERPALAKITWFLQASPERRANWIHVRAEPVPRPHTPATPKLQPKKINAEESDQES